MHQAHPGLNIIHEIVTVIDRVDGYVDAVIKVRRRQIRPATVVTFCAKMGRIPVKKKHRDDCGDSYPHSTPPSVFELRPRSKIPHPQDEAKDADG